MLRKISNKIKGFSRRHLGSTYNWQLNSYGLSFCDIKMRKGVYSKPFEAGRIGNRQEVTFAGFRDPHKDILLLELLGIRL